MIKDDELPLWSTFDETDLPFADARTIPLPVRIGAKLLDRPTTAELYARGSFVREELRSAALSYAARGWPVFTLHTVKDHGRCSCGDQSCVSAGKHPFKGHAPHGFKNATADLAVVSNWWPDESEPNKVPFNIGVVTGACSRIVVLDIDARSNGQDSLERLTSVHGALPITVQVETGGGGQHYYFAHPGYPIGSTENLHGYQGIDVKADGGYVVAPPSRHRSGRPYLFELSSLPEDTEVAPIPDWLLQLMSVRKKRVKDSAKRDNDKPISDGARTKWLVSKAGLFRESAGMEFEELNAALQTLNVSRCAPALPSLKVERIARSFCKYERGAAQYHQTDAGIAERFRDACGDGCRHVGEWNRWLVYDGARWSHDRESKVVLLMRDIIRKMIEERRDIKPWDTSPEAAKEADKKRRRIYQFARFSENNSRITAALRIARSELASVPEQFDANRHLFNTVNGTLNLKNDEFREHRQSDYITHLSPVPYRPSAKCPRFETFMDEIMSGDREMVEFLQMAFGTAVVGETSDHAAFIFWGAGANGKTSLLEVMRHVFGSYCRPTPPDTFLTKNNDQIPEDLARLQGVRLVTTTEVDEGRTLSESIFKRVTGGEVITARYLRGHFFDYEPQFTLFMATNAKPTIRGTDDGVWRRIRLVPFTETFDVNEQRCDRNLRAKLVSEASGILNWCVQGYRNWCKNGGLSMPSKVKAASQAYRRESDLVLSFFNECCMTDAVVSTQGSVVFDAFKEWNSGGRMIAQRDFVPRLEAIGEHEGFHRKATKMGKIWVGLKLGRGG